MRFYVVTSRGSWFVQAESEQARSGFFLLDEDQSWDGGLGLGEWRAVAEKDVPDAVRERLGWLMDEYVGLGDRHDMDDDEAIDRLVAEGLPVERARGLVGLTREMGWNRWRKGGAK